MRWEESQSGARDEDGF